MKKIVRLTESQLHRLIEQTINELDIRTKANAANKAYIDWSKYNYMANNPSNSSILRDYARKMANKRERQRNKFKSSVEDECGPNSIFIPSDCTFHRGGLGQKQYVHYGSDGPKYDEPLAKMIEYLKGNSYYDKERGKWLNPDDEGYDMEKSEQWAKIRRNNESLVHKVTENIIRKLRRA